MTVFMIILAVVCFILFLEVGVIIKYKDEPEVSLKILGIKIKLVPKKTKKINLRKFSAPKYRKMLLRDEENKAKAEEKKRLKDAEKKAKKQAEKEEKKSKKEDGVEEIEVSPVKVILKIIFKIITRFIGHFRIDVFKINIVVGGKDAASTAMMYGVLSQSVWYILEALDHAVHLKYKGCREVSVTPDFISGKIDADVHVVFRLRVIHILDVALNFLVRFIKTKISLDAELEPKRKEAAARAKQIQNSKKITQNNKTGNEVK